MGREIGGRESERREKRETSFSDSRLCLAQGLQHCTSVKVGVRLLSVSVSVSFYWHVDSHFNLSLCLFVGLSFIHTLLCHYEVFVK